MSLLFQEKIYNIVKKIPKGKVLTYKQVAKMAGRPNAFRAVGNILNKNYNPAIPCHRVIRSDGRVGGYNRGVAIKVKLLENEGVVFFMNVLYNNIIK
ncbi:MAG: 6-O-methylguanine DNA methyltransferase [Candidatus Staskawiczbacteria bacterium RIFCSPHIGHO2_12_FULL_38_11]|uniref:6-O-methylguanine DNA methyltransferase n=1 Tax=Candidatus Staskawiczbacteria bacterium RIFCSPHIGHO2_12_FULL_38_11 TaxID=1802209 RepID=A0A1G2I771_9BACT|nr:MAG: 6-O-methylguanine DNA methyltransferase [Candidatus Staskawiczbacteria bacterium RIFCSPHIGHO2_12_FULL_38_11]